MRVDGQGNIRDIGRTEGQRGPSKNGHRRGKLEGFDQWVCARSRSAHCPL